MKQLQNRIAESGITLAVASVFAMGIWLLNGLIAKQLWPQLAFFVASVYLFVELSNQNALLRVRSRMVSSIFILLSCTACFLFPYFDSGIVQLCFMSALLLLFQTYQDEQAMGRSFYAFLCIGLSSMVYVHTLWYVPVIWILMAKQLQSLNWRTWLASFIGLLTPYWFSLLWFLVPRHFDDEWAMDLSPVGEHFSQLFDFNYEAPSFRLGHILVIVFTVILTTTGIIHFWRYSFEDKIRIRLLYGFFAVFAIFTLVFILVQPQHFQVFMPLFFIGASPLIAHVLTLTSSRLSNILFFVAVAILIAIAAYNLIVFNSYII